MKKIPISINQIIFGKPRSTLGPASNIENPIVTSPIYITTMRETFSQSHPAIGDPIVSEIPITANA
jgi:hypothetical protein